MIEDYYGNEIFVGDIVEAVPPFILACGSGRYERAIVISSDPLVFVSEETDMRWGQVPPEEIKVVGSTHEEQIKKCFRRKKW